MKRVGLGIPKGLAVVFFCAGTASGCSVLSSEDTQSASVPSAPSASSAPATRPTGLQASDRSFAEKSRQSALENSVSGKSVVWKNPASGARGSVTPLKTWKNEDGVYCRAYTESIRPASGQSIQRRGVACRSSNAIWKSA